jgi:hypothetical protein
MPAMKTIEEIRHARLLQLLELPQFPTIQSLANAIDRSHAQLSQWKNKSKRSTGGFAVIDSASARHIETQLGLPVGWMDNAPEAVPAGLDPEAASFALRFAALDEDARHTWLALLELAEHRQRVDSARRTPAPSMRRTIDESTPSSTLTPHDRGNKPTRAGARSDTPPKPGTKAAKGGKRRGVAR